MDRRSFIKNTSVGLGAVGQIKIDKMNLSAFNSLYPSDQENDNILVIVQLFGGNDGINTIIPHEWPDYYSRLRRRLHIPANSSIGFADENLGIAMHPSLKEGLNDGILGLYNSGKLAVIQGVGYPNPNLSHFRSSDIWFSGIVPYSDHQVLPTGWLGRYFDQYQNDDLPESPYCIQLGANPLLLFQGDKTESSIELENPEDFFEHGKSVESEKIELGEKGLFSDELNFINDIGIKINHFSHAVKQAFDKGKNSVNYENNTLSSQMKLVARMIDGGLKTKVFLVSLGGFDTHASQGTTDGMHSNLLNYLSTAVSSFQADIDRSGHAKKVLGITVSEFGRRPYENASFGTDHGTSNVMFAFGDAVKPKVFGGNIAFLPFLDGQNLVHRYDFRSVYQEVIRTWFGASSLFSESVLGGRFALIDQVGFLKGTEPDATLPAEPVIPEVTENPNSPNTPVERDRFVAFPNPTTDGRVVLNMILSLDGHITIRQVDFKGHDLGILINSKPFNPGSHFVPLVLKGGAGLQILHIQNGSRHHFVKLIRL